MRRFAQRQVETLLRHLAAQIKQTAGSTDADSAHDLRVAVRRLSRALRSFAQFFPGKSGKRIRKRLSCLMDVAAAVRDNDVALELLEEAGIAKRARVAMAVQKRRREAEGTLRQELHAWLASDFSHEWRKELDL